MNAPLRRGACPALSAPMPTGDGLLIRLSPVSGGLSPKQLIGLCESAARYGNGIVEVTARGSFQFRGFSAASVGRFAEDVDSLGIVVRTGVPVEVSPLAGMDPQEIGDSVSVAARIRQGILTERLEGRLGPKVSVVVDGGGQISLDSVAADVLLKVGIVDGEALWQVVIAGDAHSATQLGWFTEDRSAAAALSILTEIAALGFDARARDLTTGDNLNRLRCTKPTSFCSTLPPSVLPDISPSRGEIAPAALLSPTGAIGRTASPKLPISTLVGEMSGRTEGGNVEQKLIDLFENAFTLPISLPFGHIDAARLSDLVHRAEALGVTDIRPAPDRTLLPICPSIEATQTLHGHAAKLGFITNPADIRKNIAACPGSPACASGKIAARAIAEEVARSLPPGTPNLSIHISGCEKGCARQASADITIVGGENGAGLVVHGTIRERPLAYRSAGGMAGAIAAVVKKLRVERPTDMSKASDKTTTALSPAQLACLKAAFEQDRP